VSLILAKPTDKYLLRVRNRHQDTQSSRQLTPMTILPSEYGTKLKSFNVHSHFLSGPGHCPAPVKRSALTEEAAQSRYLPSSLRVSVSFM